MRMACRLGLHLWVTINCELRKGKFRQTDVVLETQECGYCDKTRQIEYPNFFDTGTMIGYHMFDPNIDPPSIPQPEKFRVKK